MVRSRGVNGPISLLLLLSIAATAARFAAASATPAISFPEGISSSSSNDDNCVYTIYVRTGSIWKGGTDSIIGVVFLDADGYGVSITDLESWGGLMGDGYNYYERGNLDIFSGKGPCMPSPPCRMNLTSDGSGPHHGWYCNYVEVTTTGPHVPCAQQLFTVEQWLATDTSPHQLFAVRDNCPAPPPPKDGAAAATVAGILRRGVAHVM